MDAHKIVWRSLPLLVVIFFSVYPAVAQSFPLLTFNETVSGQVRVGQPQTWQFVARTGAMLSVYVQALDPMLDPIVTLFGTNGEILLVNDDVRPGSLKDALLEGFSIPRNGTYSLTVSSFNNSVGTYELTLLTGFAEMRVKEDFSNNPVWQTLLENTGSPLLEIDTITGAMQIDLVGVNQSGIVTVGAPTASVFQDFYTTVDVDMTGRNGWRAGLAIRHVDEQNYYLYSLDSNGLWSFTVYENGAARVLYDQGSHPAITQRYQFSLGVLANTNKFEFFYNGQQIGAVLDDTILEGGRIGFMATTLNIPESSISAQFDNYAVTQPLILDNEPIFPQAFMVLDGNSSVQELQRRRLIPGSGVMVLDGQTGSVRDDRAGVWRIPLDDREIRNFVFSTVLSWSSLSNDVTGCGIALRVTEAEGARYELAFVTSDGAYGLQHREPDAFSTDGVYGETLPPGYGDYHLLIVGLEDMLHLYIDGTYRGTLMQPARAGTLNETVINHTAGRTICNFEQIWLWQITQ
jgi:hypothetical protein